MNAKVAAYEFPNAEYHEALQLAEDLAITCGVGWRPNLFQTPTLEYKVRAIYGAGWSTNLAMVLVMTDGTFTASATNSPKTSNHSTPEVAGETACGYMREIARFNVLDFCRRLRNG